MPDLKLQTLRVVWFMSGQPAGQATDLFRGMVGVDAQGSQMNQAPQPPGGAVWNVTGHDADFAYQLAVQLGRVDMVITAHAPSGPPPDGAPLMASVPRAIERAVQIGARAADLMPPSVRVALVGEFLYPTQGLEEANAALSQVLGPDLIAADSTDLVFQINRRKALARLAGVSMNRVLHWSVATIQTIMFAVPPTGNGMLLPGLGGPMSMQGAQVKQSFAASLRVDINTHTEGLKAFSALEQRDILLEFSAELTRLAAANSPRALT